MDRNLGKRGHCYGAFADEGLAASQRSALVGVS